MNTDRIYNLILIRDIKNLLTPIALHDMVLSKYALILVHFPMKKSKLDIFLKLDKCQRVGMLNRYILGVASKIGIYQTLLKYILILRNKHKKYKKYVDDDKTTEKFWQKIFDENQKEMTKQYDMLLDFMIEETNRRNDPRYLRKKKLNEIKHNLQN